MPNRICSCEYIPPLNSYSTSYLKVGQLTSSLDFFGKLKLLGATIGISTWLADTLGVTAEYMFSSLGFLGEGLGAVLNSALKLYRGPVLGLPAGVICSSSEKTLDNFLTSHGESMFGLIFSARSASNNLHSSAVIPPAATSYLSSSMFSLSDMSVINIMFYDIQCVYMYTESLTMYVYNY